MNLTRRFMVRLKTCNVSMLVIATTSWYTKIISIATMSNKRINVCSCHIRVWFLNCIGRIKHGSPVRCITFGNTISIQRLWLFFLKLRWEHSQRYVFAFSVRSSSLYSKLRFIFIKRKAGLVVDTWPKSLFLILRDLKARYFGIDIGVVFAVWYFLLNRY